MSDLDTMKIATLRGPSAVEMAVMLKDSAKAVGPEVTVYDEPSVILGKMSLEAVDFAVLPSAMAGLLNAKSLSYREVAVMIWGGLYVCGVDASVKGVADLKGRTINVLALSSPPEMMLRKLLVSNGLVPDEDVVFDRSFPTHKALAQAVSDGESKLCILPEPYLSIALEKNKDLKVLADLAGEWQKTEGSLPKVTSLFCRNSLVKQRPDAVDDMISALSRSCDWVNSNPGEASALIVELGIFDDRDAVAKSIPRSGFNVIPVK